jgi:hypothetical protein
VQHARARSDELGLFMRIKTERNTARERLRPLGVSIDGGQVRFHRATITVVDGAPVCSIGEIARRASFGEASLTRPESTSTPLCIDENGRPVGEFEAVIKASDGRESSLRLSPTGVFETSLSVGSHDVGVVNVSTAPVASN